MQAVGIRAGAAVIALTILVCVVAVAGREPLPDTGGAPAETPERAAEVAVPPPAEFPVPGALPPEVFVFEEPEPGTPAWLVWTMAVIGALGIAAAGALLLRGLWRGSWRQWRLRWRRGRARPRPAARPSTAVAERDVATARRAVDAASEPLRAPANPRAAVIEAYARMEEVLAERDFARRAPEVPREYLTRVLRERGMPERSLTTLTDLFEEARFSLHPIPESAPRRALSELETARRALTATRDLPPASSTT
jgi:uncharacterized protein DUF4129